MVQHFNSTYEYLLDHIFLNLLPQFIFIKHSVELISFLLFAVEGTTFKGCL